MVRKEERFKLVNKRCFRLDPSVTTRGKTRQVFFILPKIRFCILFMMNIIQLNDIFLKLIYDESVDEDFINQFLNHTHNIGSNKIMEKK